MQTSKNRSGSLEMAQKNPVSSPNSKQSINSKLPQSPSKSTRGKSLSFDLSDSKGLRVVEQKTSIKSASVRERRAVKKPEMQQQINQLQEELKKAKEEKSQALEEFEEFRSRKKMSSVSTEKLDSLQSEVEKAKESERRMLESLMSQTKQLEQTKISLEEAKLEIRSLEESSKCLKEIPNQSKNQGSVEKNQGSVEEIGLIRNELKLATEAEENSKKAMDGLALALKEVTTELNQVKEKLSFVEPELEKSRSEAEKFKSLMQMTDEKLRAKVEECETLKLESEELVATWNEKENGFINCMKVSEEEMTKSKVENEKLIESLRVSREENLKLRDILKQAINEANIVKEALEIARNENSRLQDSLSEKENALQSVRQEYDCLKVSEAAALDSVEELKGFLAATSTMEDSSSKISVNEMSQSKLMATSPSDQWRSDTKNQIGRNHYTGRTTKSIGSVLDIDGPSIDRKGRMYGSVSNASEFRVPSSLFSGSDDFDRANSCHLSVTEHENGLPAKQKKKKPMMRRFKDMLRRRSFHK